MKCYRQGDVLLRKIPAMPKNLTKKDNVLAYGEITNHHHRFAPTAQVTVFADANKQQFVQVKAKSVLEHEDHAHIQIPKGMYEVVIQREFDLVEGIRKVMD